MSTAIENPPDTNPATEVASDVPEQEKVYRWNGWVHVGPDAEKCAHTEDGACKDTEHFHAWVRLPNPVQRRELAEKALAAKARLVRQLKDPDTDAGAIIEDYVDQLAALGDAAREPIIDDLLDRSWHTHFLGAIADLAEHETDDGEHPYEYVERDQQRYQELDALPEDERPAAEYEELSEHLSGYAQALTGRTKERQQPERDALEAKDFNDLLDMVRADRIEQRGDREMDHVFALHQWVHCTRVTPNGARVFKSLDALDDASPEVIEALRDAYNELSAGWAEGKAG